MVKKNLVEKVKGAVLPVVMGVGLAISSSGCGTTFHIKEKQVWYECNTNGDYPKEHPCSGPVEDYRAANPKKTVSSEEMADKYGELMRTSYDQR